MQTNHNKAASVAEKPSQKIPRTQLETLRELLRDLELSITRLRAYNAEEALQLLVSLDQAAEILDRLHQAGGVIGSEDSQFETVKAQFYGQRQRFLSRVGGRSVLDEARREHQPPQDHWWWFVDQSLTQERQALARRVLAIAGIVALVFAALFLLYQYFWKPDPAFQASVGFQTTAENLLIEARYDEALVAVNQALDYRPENPNLLALRGVIYETLEQPELAAQDFEIALAEFPGEDRFYAERAGYYLMAGMPEQTLTDAEAAIAINPDLAMGFLRKAQAHEMLEEYDLAIENYELAADAAERTGNPQLQVIARMSLGSLLQAGPALSTQPAE